MSNHEKKIKANHLEIELACMKDYEDLTEKDLRIQLAASYRLVEELGWSFLIFGHLTARVPGTEKNFLINPYGLMYDEINASNLVKINLEGKKVEESDWEVNPAGFIIHSADDKAVPVHNSILFYNALIENGISTEMHIFPFGGHGFALAKGKNYLEEWPELLYNWILNL